LLDLPHPVGKGGKVGPDLTTFKRDDLDTMLLWMCDPNAEDPRRLRRLPRLDPDGRTLGGLMVDQDPRIVVLRNAEGRDVSDGRDEIEEMEATKPRSCPKKSW